MRRQRNMAQIKEQNKIPEKELNKVKTSNLLDSEVKTLIIRMLKELSEKLNSIRKQVRNKGYTSEIKNNLQGINNRVHEVKNQIRQWEDKKAENTQSEKQEEKKFQWSGGKLWWENGDNCI